MRFPVALFSESKPRQQDQPNSLNFFFQSGRSVRRLKANEMALCNGVLSNTVKTYILHYIKIVNPMST